MKYTVLNLLLMLSIGFSLSGCLGYESQDNTLIGQVKKVQQATPIICPNYTRADISLGVMRNGVGSMSSQDIWVYVANNKDLETLNSAVTSGSLVKIKYNTMRAAFCTPNAEVTSVEIAQ